MDFISVKDFIDYLKFQLSISQSTDTVLQSVTDEELLLTTKMIATKYKLNLSTEDKVPFVYSEVLSCYVRVEIYWKLALANAPLYDMKVGDIELLKGQRFKHYHSLIVDLEAKLQELNEDLRKQGLIGSGNVFEYSISSNANSFILKPYNFTTYLNSREVGEINMSYKFVEDVIRFDIDFSSLDKRHFRGYRVYKSLNDKPCYNDYTRTFNTEIEEVTYEPINIKNNKFEVINNMPSPLNEGDINTRVEHYTLEVYLTYDQEIYYNLEVSL